MQDIIQISVMLFLFYILFTVLLNLIQSSLWDGIKIKVKNKKIIGKEQPIYFINEEYHISKYIIELVDCEGLNFFFFMLFPIRIHFKKLGYIRVGGYYITEAKYNNISNSDDLEKIYNEYFENANKKYLEEDKILSENELKLKKLNEKFTLNYGEY